MKLNVTCTAWVEKNPDIIDVEYLVLRSCVEPIYVFLNLKGLTPVVSDDKSTRKYDLPVSHVLEISYDNFRVLLEDEESSHDFLTSPLFKPRELDREISIELLLDTELGDLSVESDIEGECWVLHGVKLNATHANKSQQ